MTANGIIISFVKTSFSASTDKNKLRFHFEMRSFESIERKLSSVLSSIRFVNIMCFSRLNYWITPRDFIMNSDFSNVIDHVDSNLHLFLWSTDLTLKMDLRKIRLFTWQSTRFSFSMCHLTFSNRQMRLSIMIFNGLKNFAVKIEFFSIGKRTEKEKFVCCKESRCSNKQSKRKS